MQEANENKELCSVHLGQKIKDFSFSTYNPVTDSFEEHSFSEYGLLRKWIVLYFYPAEQFFRSVWAQAADSRLRSYVCTGDYFLYADPLQRIEISEAFRRVKGIV